MLYLDLSCLHFILVGVLLLFSSAASFFNLNEQILGNLIYQRHLPAFVVCVFIWPGISTTFSHLNLASSVHLAPPHANLQWL